VITVLGVLACWGITESVTVAALLTLVEIAGLLLVVFVGGEDLPQLTEQFSAMETGFGQLPWLGIFAGAFLAFYAYIGFEDMVNVAEEVKDPQHTMPKAILWSVVISTLLYAAVSLVALAQLSPQQLMVSKAPLADVYSAATGKAPVVISLIGLFAVVNGVLIQIIMASRILFGMAQQGWLPRMLARVNPRTRTPILSTGLVTLLILGLALLASLVTLAHTTSFLVLTVFALVNLALIRIKRQQPQPDGVRVFPWWLPVLGVSSVVVFLLLELGAGWL